MWTHKGAKQEVSSVTGVLEGMSEHVFDWTQALRNVDGKEVGGMKARSRRKVYPEARTLVCFRVKHVRIFHKDPLMVTL